MTACHGAGLGLGAAAEWAGAACWQILQTDFGAGLDFLATWDAFRRDPAPPARLFYSAILAQPTAAEALLRAGARRADWVPLAGQLAAQWHGLLPGVHRLQFEGGRLQLTLAIGAVQPMLAELSGQFDTILLDHAGVGVPEDRWTPHALKAVARLARRGARLVSPDGTDTLRARLKGCGFLIDHTPAEASEDAPLRARFAPHWQPRPRAGAAALALPTPAAPRRCAVIGAGLAGAAAAFSLAARGWQVTVLDRADAPAAGASGLPAGVVAPHVSPDDRPLSRLTRAGVQAMLARARQLLREGTDYGVTGVLERHAPGDRRPPAWPPEVMNAPASRPLTQIASAETVARAGVGTPLGQAALWHAHAGWVKPAALVRAMLAAPGIEWRGSQTVASVTLGVRPDANTLRPWQLLGPGGALLAQADLVVVAAGFDTRALLQQSGAGEPPLHALRGQVAFGPMPAPGDALPRFPVNGHGSVIAHVPSPVGPQWVAGATFDRGNDQPELREGDHAVNRQRLGELLPAAGTALGAQFDDGRAHAWAAVRCTVPDRLPLLGPSGWPADGAALPLCLNTAMGARGLTLAVLCGDILAASLHDEPLPVERTLAAHLRASRWRAV